MFKKLDSHASADILYVYSNMYQGKNKNPQVMLRISTLLGDPKGVKAIQYSIQISTQHTYTGKPKS